MTTSQDHTSGDPPAFFGLTGEPRLLWHPGAHEYFDERCYFFLLSGEFGRGRLVVEGLTKLLARLNLTPSSINTVYGPYDVILRIWLTGPARLKFQRALSELTDDEFRVENLLEFSAHTVEYAWLHGVRSLSYGDFDSVEEEMRLVVRAQATGQWSPKARLALDRFTSQSSSILHLYTQPSGTRFYVFVTPRPGLSAQQPDFVTKNLYDLGDQLGEYRECLTVYSGVGFCSYLVKAVVEKYEDVLPFVRDVQQRMDALGLRCWTLVAADVGERGEGETIDAVLDQIPYRLDQFVRGARKPEALGRLVRSFSAQQQTAIAELYSFGRNELTLEQGQDRYFELLEETVFGDRRTINQTLSFLTSIEGDLRELLPGLAAKYCNQDWLEAFLRRVESERKAAGAKEPPRARVSNLTLFDLLEMLRGICDDSPDAANIFDFHLPKRWRHMTRTVLELRNEYSHSRLGADLRSRDFLDGRSNSKLRDLVFAIAFQRGVERVLENYGPT